MPPDPREHPVEERVTLTKGQAALLRIGRCPEQMKDGTHIFLCSAKLVKGRCERHGKVAGEGQAA